MNYATLTIKQLKEIAASKSIVPAGDKRKRQTWLNALTEAAIENIADEMDSYFDADMQVVEASSAPAPAVTKPRRYTLVTANAALAGTGYTIVHNTKHAANKTNEHRLGWYEIFADGKRRHNSKTLKNVIAWAYEAIEHEARCLRILAGTEKVS